MGRVFAIGDIHGCSKTFRKLLLEEIQIQKTDQIYCVGDYVDRGPDSRGVIDFIFELKEQKYEVHTLRGNHEEMLLKSSRTSRDFDLWVLNGGMSTLKSFGLSSAGQLDHRYRDFFRETKYFIETNECIFVHAGLNFRNKDPFEDKHAMLWTRNFPVDQEKLRGKWLIHGHTPQSAGFILSQPFESPFNIDGGCVYKEYPEYGNLVALNVSEKKVLMVRNAEGEW